MTIASVAYQIKDRPTLLAIQAGDVPYQRKLKGVFVRDAKWFASYKTPWGFKHEPTYLSLLEFSREEVWETLSLAEAEHPDALDVNSTVKSAPAGVLTLTTTEGE